MDDALSLSPQPSLRNAARLPGPAWVRVVAVLALAKVLASLAGLAAAPAPDAYFPPAVHFAVVAVFALAGGALLYAGARDPRAVSLGIFFLLVATSFTGPLLSYAADRFATWRAVPLVLASIHLDVFQPYFLWRFVRDFPRTPLHGGGGRGVRWMLRTLLLLGTVLLAVNLAAPLIPANAGAPLASWLSCRGRTSLFWPLLLVPMLGAVAHAVRQARRATPDERRRAWLMLAGLVAGTLPMMLVLLAASVFPAFLRYMERPEGAHSLGWIVFPPLLSIPFVTAYAVLRHRALDLQLILRKALQYALARYTIAGVASLPFAGAVWMVYLNREHRLVQLWSGRTGLLLGGAMLAGVLMVRLRPWVLERLDRRFFREQYDAHRILGSLVERTRALRAPEEAAAVLAGEMDRALHLRGVEVLLLDPSTGVLADPSGAAPALGLSSPLARTLQAQDGPVEVDWTRPAPWLARLSAADRHWLADRDTRLLVPVTAADGALLGIFALGEKRSELPFSAQDRLLLSTIAASAGLALEYRLRLSAAPAGGRPSAAEEPARECPACGTVCEAAVAVCPECGVPMVPAAVPLVLAGKFRMQRRIGSGGMGVVYAAVDLELDRGVAIKTLPRMGLREARWLRSEARAMAAVWHPNLALILGAESWQGVPMLVVEHLQGGTLDARIACGPLELEAVLETVGGVVQGLARLHGAEILHRDIKPSNIGFTADGTPKLLDFGLAHVLDTQQASVLTPAAGSGRLARRTDTGAAGGRGGTPLYLSPEAARGEAPDAHVDLWALCMVMYEALAGVHPFAGDTPHWAVVRAAEADVPDLRELHPCAPAAAAEFLRGALHADRGRRPSSARELARQIAALSRAAQPAIG